MYNGVVSQLVAQSLEKACPIGIAMMLICRIGVAADEFSTGPFLALLAALV